MIDDLEEINLTPTPSGSARKTRAGRKRAANALVGANKAPRWLRQLRGSNAARTKKKS
jgi:hypothetical protein